MLYAFSVKHEKRPTWLMLEHSIKRSFGGFEDDKIDTEKIFQTFASHLKEIVGEVKKVFLVNKLAIRKDTNIVIKSRRIYSSNCYTQYKSLIFHC